ncbi:extensin [Streptomyces sp. GESEQ-35]|uniref:extensin n=1 Tax=Streptomyces sp. GESEQ-35 TaxID=2812657 RepID=UPI001B3300ED|nr:extensin [Streptomyces sp. GESEQ-35]
MADEQCRWLDRETAELLLRGASLEAVDPAARDRAARLAETLGALSAAPPPTGAELPGEAAALAAFRKVRAEKGEGTVVFGGARHGAADAGLVRIGTPVRAERRPHWARPLRLGVAAALAAVMVGGVGVAAGTGVLPTPFGGEEPAPGASVSAAATPERPLVSPPPKDTPDGGSGTPAPEDAPSGPTGGPPPQHTQPGGQAPDENPGTQGRADGFRNWWGSVTAACRDVRDGKELPADRRRALQDMAGGSGRVTKYCKAVLNAADGDDASGESRDGSGKDRGENKDDDESGRDGDDDGSGIVPGDTRDDSAPLLPDLNPLLPKRATTASPGSASPEPAPSPSYSVLGAPGA